MCISEHRTFDVFVSRVAQSFGVFRSRVKFGDSTTTAISVVLVYMHSTFI